MLVSGDAETTPFLFNGMYGVMSDGNGLYHMRARYYSPEIRRFVNQDVLLDSVSEGQTLNRYAFVTGRPVSFVDPFGLATIEIPFPEAPAWVPEWVKIGGARIAGLIAIVVSIAGDTPINKNCQLFYRGDYPGKTEFWAPLLEEKGIEAAKKILETVAFEELAAEHASGSIDSPFISITTSIRVARLYAKGGGDGGVVYEVWLPPGMAIENVFNDNAVWDGKQNEAVLDEEWLVPLHIGPEFVNSMEGCSCR
ncbi:MAG: hypothetical protein DRR19_30915 [Candidatus Parabeggiatoa sp. nov. 1]|nr:MAG: hypothetical protein DRR19_30915 [Gammaproteobacteria bacterium]